MRILLVGYGKMGQAIEKIAVERGHEIVGKIGVNNATDLALFNKQNTDVAIEFTRPEVGLSNITTCIKAGIPTVSGTTGWLDQWDSVLQLTQETQGAFFYASNFSIGVNIFFQLNKQLAKMMNHFNDYTIEMEEIHHIHKLDAPSGTAITLAEGIFDHVDRKSNWSLEKEKTSTDVAIKAVREGEVPGTHIINYNSPIDTIEIKHEAHNRKGFASGAVLAAEFIATKKGVFGMEDMLKF